MCDLHDPVDKVSGQCPVSGHCGTDVDLLLPRLRPGVSRSGFLIFDVCPQTDTTQKWAGTKTEFLQSCINIMIKM